MFARYAQEITAKLTWRNPKLPLECAREGFMRLEPGIQRNVRDRLFTDLQGICASFDPQPADIFLYCFADGLAKYAVKVKSRKPDTFLPAHPGLNPVQGESGYKEGSRAAPARIF